MAEAREYLVTQRVSGTQVWIVQATSGKAAVQKIRSAVGALDDTPDVIELPWEPDRMGALRVQPKGRDGLGFDR
jgi:hypothetical protein